MGLGDVDFKEWYLCRPSDEIILLNETMIVHLFYPKFSHILHTSKFI